MIYEDNTCVDLDNDFCPCELAVENECLECVKNQGGSCEDCHWNGVCVYSQYKLDGEKILNKRTSKKAEIVSREFYSDDLLVIGLKVDRSFALSCSKSGTFIFVGNPDYENDYQVPLSVLKTKPTECLLYVAVQRNGIKTKTIFKAENNLIIRGPYFSGLMGKGGLYKNPTKIVLIAKGIAIAPFGNILAAMTREERNKTYCFIDLERISLDFFKDYFGTLPLNKIKMINMQEDIEEIKNLLVEEEKNITNFYVLASPFYSEQFRKKVKGGMVLPNHGNMCCGEGICGACTCSNKEGAVIKRCKKPELI